MLNKHWLVVIFYIAIPIIWIIVAGEFIAIPCFKEQWVECTNAHDLGEVISIISGVPVFFYLLFTMPILLWYVDKYIDN